MAKTFGSQIDLLKIPVLGLVPQSSATASPPATPANGQLWYDTTVNRLKVYENGSFVIASQSGVILSGATAGGGLTGTYPNPTLATNSVTTATITDANVTYAKIQNVVANAFIGNPTGSTAAPQAITLAGDHSFSGTTLQLGAFTGDITKSAGSLATTIGNNTVTYAKMQDVSATNKLIGRVTAGAGDPEEIGLAADLAFSSGNLQVGAFTGDITKSAASLATTIAANAVTIAKLATSVNLNAIATANAATADITASGFKLTNVGTPTVASDAATKSYVDGIATGLDWKASVRAASTATVTVTYNATGGTSARGQMTAMPNTLDGVTLAANDRVLLKNQSTGAQNGIWVVTTLGTGANGVWDRATDFDQDAEVTAGSATFVTEGTTNADTGWVLTTNDPIIIGGGSGTSLAFAQFSSSASLTAGNGINIASNVVSVVGTSNRISVSGAGVDIAATYVGQTSITTLGTITTGTWTGTSIAVLNGGTGATTAAGARTNLGATGKYSATLAALSAGVELNINHALNTTEVIAMFRDASTNFEIVFSWRVVDANNIGVTADVAYGSSAVKVVVVG